MVESYLARSTAVLPLVGSASYKIDHIKIEFINEDIIRSQIVIAIEVKYGLLIGLNSVLIRVLCIFSYCYPF